VVRLGSRRAIALDVRLVAATNVDLHKAVGAGRFRADLYYRLSVAPVSLPPLYQRPGDILPLARHFIQTYGDKMQLGQVALSPDAARALLAYEWPGNIRELENVIHYALIVCSGGQIDAADLKLVGAMHRQDAAAPQRQPDRLETLFEQMIESGDQQLFERVEETLVRTAFNWCHQNQVQTARALGVSRNILRTQLKRFGMIGAEAEA